MVVFATLAVGASAQPPDLGPLPEQGVLLLRNGQSIQGKITRAGELYYVALPHGEIRVKAADVEFCCRDLEQGYRRKRAAICVGNVQDHLRLAQWCQGHGLLGYAARELADAIDADPRHPMIGVLKRRLDLARQPPKEPSQPAKPIDRPPSPEDLDGLVRGLPSGSVESFKQAIQPMLINHCTAAACHGPDTQAKFRLLRIPVGRPPSRLVTQRNLQATLQSVDRQQPAASPLLTVPVRPHATAKTAIFTNRQVAQYQRLVEWVRQVADRPEAKVPATVVPKEKPPVQAMAAESPGPGFHSPPADQQPAVEPKLKDPFAETFPLQPDLPGVQFVPIDPFDPEIFNRRYFP